MIGLYENAHGQFLYVWRSLDCRGAHLDGFHVAEYTDLGHTYWLARRVPTANFGGRVRVENPDGFGFLFFNDRAKPVLQPHPDNHKHRLALAEEALFT